MPFFHTPRAPSLTPCIGICRLRADGLCEGCHRNVEEIAAWSTFSDAQRRHLMEEVLPKRAEHDA